MEGPDFSEPRSWRGFAQKATTSRFWRATNRRSPKIDGADVVINLAGEPIAEGRWTRQRKAAIHDSRVQTTRAIVSALQAAQRKPSVLISGSAIGIYGPRGDEPVTEDTPIANPSVSGPLNVTAPNPVTNRDFSQALGRVLGRPAIMPAPAIALRVALGEMADVLLTGQRVLPAKAQALGFEFRYPQLEDALRAALT